MQVLNFPTYKFRIKSNENNYAIFDIIRKKYVALTPEEWVRQHFIHYLTKDKGYPVSLIAIEKKLQVNKLTKRADILVFDTKGNPNIIIECKSPSIQLTQSTFDQVARYNSTLNAEYLIVTNGLKHLYCKIDLSKEEYIFLKNIPDYSQI